METTNGNLKQLVLPFGIKSLFMKELLLLLLDLELLLALLDLLNQLLLLLFVVEGVLTHLVDSDLQLRDPHVFKVIVRVFLIQGCDQLY